MTTEAAARREPPTTKRRLRVHFTPELVAQMLGLPSGHHLVAVETQNDPLGLLAIVEGPAFPESPHHSQSPIGYFNITVHRDRETDDVLHVERELTWFAEDGWRRSFDGVLHVERELTWFAEDGWRRSFDGSKKPT